MPVSADLFQEIRLTAMGWNRQHLDHLEQAGHLKVELLILLSSQRGELGLKKGFGMFQDDKGPCLEPVAAGDLAEVGRAESALELGLAQQLTRCGGIGQGQN